MILNNRISLSLRLEHKVLREDCLVRKVVDAQGPPLVVAPKELLGLLQTLLDHREDLALRRHEDELVEELLSLLVHRIYVSLRPWLQPDQRVLLSLHLPGLLVAPELSKGLVSEDVPHPQDDLVRDQFLFLRKLKDLLAQVEDAVA